MAIGDPRENPVGRDPRASLGVSGNSASNRGAITASPVTTTQADNIIPTFLQNFVEPYIKKKQNEAFYNGFVAQAAGEVEVEVLDTDNPISRIWGPTGFQEGASFFKGQELTTNLSRQWNSELDTLKQMPPEELAKKLAKDADGLLTGNDLTDGFIRKQTIEAMRPMIDTVQKARYEWQQNNAMNAAIDAQASAGSALQEIAVKQASTVNLTAEDTDAHIQAENNFVGLLAKTAGRTDASYKVGIVQSAQRLMREGNFYAVEVMRKHGMWDVLDEKDAARLDGQYLKEGRRNIEAAREQLMPQIIDLNKQVLGEQISPRDAMARYFQLNATAAKLTGIRDIDLFDAKEVEKGTIDLLQLQRATALRNEAREEANRVRLEDREWARQDKAEEAQAKVDSAKFAWQMGTVKTALAGGYTTEDMMTGLAISAFNNDRVEELVHPARMEGYVSSGAAAMIQNGIKSGIGEPYTDVQGKSYERWKRMTQLQGGPAAAAAYFGDYHVNMLALDNYMASNPNMTVGLAWARAFGTGAAEIAQVDPARRKAVGKAVDAVVEKSRGGWWFMGKTDIPPSTKRLLTEEVTDYVATAGKFDPASEEVLAKQGYDARIATGRLEHYGKFAWRNPQNTTPLWAGTSINQERFTDVLEEEVSAQLKAKGFKAGSNGDDYLITRAGSRLLIMATDKDGKATTTAVTLQDLKNRQGKFIAEKRTKLRADTYAPVFVPGVQAR